jgi:peptidoglycan/LPS O-acetylase OafA/YrhL
MFRRLIDDSKELLNFGMNELYRTAKLRSVKYFPVLDALRFVLALWVTIGHYEPFPLFAGVDTSTRFGSLVTHAWRTVVFGNPAVIGFFVISGFCIHLPFIGCEKFPIGSYYLRRYTRILIPLAAALVVFWLSGQKLLFWGNNSILWKSMLWSLVCEEIYYAVYPLLRVIRQRTGWKILFPVAFIAGAGIAATQPHAQAWDEFGPIGTAAILLPVWLLGCILAEQSATIPVMTSSFRIWMWRFLIWLACWICEVLHFKAHVPYTQTMVWFGVLAYFWVKNEIAYSQFQKPNRHLVAAGAWSYSLYLIHTSQLEFFPKLGLPNLGFLLNWIAGLVYALAMSYVFYLLVEGPSHRLARKIKVSPPEPALIAESAAVTAPPAKQYQGSDQ